jgi:hypothetical protein
MSGGGSVAGAAVVGAAVGAVCMRMLPKLLEHLSPAPPPPPADPAPRDYPELDLPEHGRYKYRAITDRPDYSWPEGKRLAVYFALNLEHFASVKTSPNL